MRNSNTLGALDAQYKLLMDITCVFKALAALKALNAFPNVKVDIIKWLGDFKIGFRVFIAFGGCIFPKVAADIRLCMLETP